MSVAVLQVPGLAPQTSAPTSYPHGVTDRVPRPVPDIVVPASLNARFVDPSYGRQITRVSNATVGPTPGSSHRMLSSEQACAWGRASDRYVSTTPSGAIALWMLDTTKGEAAFVRQLPFTNEPTFSRVRPSIVYGAIGFQIVAYDTDAQTKTVLWDLAQFDPTYAVTGLYLGGSVQSSASVPERLIAFYGGSSSDKHFRAVVFEASNPANALVYDTMAKTINGQPVPVDAAFHIHAIGLDQSGRFAVIYPAGIDQSAGAAPMYAWELATGIITANRTFPWGHDCCGYGLYVNNTGDFGSPYDAFQYAYRSLSDLVHPTRVISPQLTPQLVNSDGHPQWNNARADVVTPFLECTMRFYENIPQNLETDPTHRTNVAPWRACDNAIVSIDPTSGAFWQWCHHFADIYADDGGPMNQSFWYQPMAQPSPDGRWNLFSSNMRKTLGKEPKPPNASTIYRSDLFLVDTTIPIAGAPSAPSNLRRLT